MLRFALLVGLSWSNLVTAQAPAAPVKERWEPEIAKLVQQQTDAPVAAGKNLFIGSSSIRLWKLANDFPNHVCVNNGFGGCTMADVLRYADRLIPPRKPSVVVVYAGDNDLARGDAPQQIARNFAGLVEVVHAALPRTKVYVISAKPSPRRWAMKEQFLETNRLLKAYADQTDLVEYVDGWSPLVDEQGEPIPEYYQKDQLHLSPAGYAKWNELIAPVLAR